MVMMSSGVSLYLCGLSDSLENGVKEAGHLIRSGKAQEILEKLIAYTSTG
jgi:anthranilate phosphoribosyltransferase